MKLSLKFLVLFERLRLRKARAVIVFLLFSTARKHRNDKIIDLLWRGSDTKKANASLRQALRHLRLASEGIVDLPMVTGNAQIIVELANDWSLVEDLALGLKDDAEFDETARYICNLLDSLELLLGISDSFDSWIEVTRARSLAHFQKVLEDILEHDETEFALRAAEFLIDIEPHNETATRFVMVHDWRNKSANRAVATYNRLYAYLDEAFDQEPEIETIELLAAIKMNPDGGDDRYVRQPAPTQVTLAIQGASPVSIDRRDASFQAVLVSDLRMRLSRFREWQVVDTPPDDNDFLLITLQLHAIGDSYRLSVEASRPSQRELLWSELIDDPQSNWYDKARLIVFNISNALRIVVTDLRASDDRAAQYDRWLRSLALIGTWNQTDEEEAVELLNKITVAAPQFGPAHAELAGVYNIRHILRPGTFQTENIKNLALSHALEALASDPLDTRAHRVLAWCYCHKAEFDLAEFHFDQALLLNPQNPHTVASAALGFAFCDNTERAADLNEEVERLQCTMEPFHLIYLAATNYLIGNFETALQQCFQGSGLMATVGGWHSASLVELGRIEEARARLKLYHSEIAEVWNGQQPATPERVNNWFVSVFPLRKHETRTRLKETLDRCWLGQ